MKKQKKYYARIGTALFLLCNPNIHVIDILPDFIAYFLLFSVILNVLRHTPFITLGTSAIFSFAAFAFTHKCLTADGTKSQNGVFQNVKLF